MLEVCPWRLSMNAELRDFVDAAVKLYGAPRFKVRNKHGLPPTLVLSSKGGATSQRTRIDAWKKGAILDYLSTRLAAAPPPAAVAAGEL